MSTLEERIKGYEAATRFKLTPRSNIIVRVDGRAFHTFTKGMERPFDKRLRKDLDHSALELAKDMQNVKAIYAQSDEISYWLTGYDKLETQLWFGGVVQKIASVSASSFTAYFAHKRQGYEYEGKIATFDSRAFVVPSIEEVINYFIWRAKDCRKNSTQVVARENFSHKELHGKKIEEIKRMLGEFWEDKFDNEDLFGRMYIKNEAGEWTLKDISDCEQFGYNKTLEFLKTLV